jgi:hypothetical protein
MKKTFKLFVPLILLVLLLVPTRSAQVRDLIRTVRGRSSLAATLPWKATKLSKVIWSFLAAM